MRLWILVLICIYTVVLHPCATACQTENIYLVLDIGHTESDPGAMSAHGVTEVEYNKKLSNILINSLQRYGIANIDVIKDKTIKERIAYIKNKMPDFVISIHHDSVQKRYLQEWRVSGIKREFSDRFSGFSIFINKYHSQFNVSRDIATNIGLSLLKEGFKPTYHHAEAIPGENRPLLDARIALHHHDKVSLLKKSTVPTILIEAGVIKNRTEEIKIRNSDYHIVFAKAVVMGLLNYCDE